RSIGYPSTATASVTFVIQDSAIVESIRRLRLEERTDFDLARSGPVRHRRAGPARQAKTLVTRAIDHSRRPLGRRDLRRRGAGAARGEDDTSLSRDKKQLRCC